MQLCLFIHRRAVLTPPSPASALPLRAPTVPPGGWGFGYWLTADSLGRSNLKKSQCCSTPFGFLRLLVAHLWGSGEQGEPE